MGRRVFKMEEKILNLTAHMPRSKKEDDQEDLSLDALKAPEDKDYKDDKISQLAMKMETVEQEVDYHREQISQHADIIVHDKEKIKEGDNEMRNSLASNQEYILQVKKTLKLINERIKNLQTGGKGGEIEDRLDALEAKANEVKE